MDPQVYPDLMDPWRLTIVPVVGLPTGAGFLLHGAESQLALARRLGFRPTQRGYLFDPGSRDPDHREVLIRLRRAVAEHLPQARFVFLDPGRFAVPVAGEGEAFGEEAARYRFRLRSAIAAAPTLPPPDLRSKPLALGLIEVARQALDVFSAAEPRMTALPHAVGIGRDQFAYAVREADGIRFGVATDRPRPRTLTGILLSRARTGRGAPAFTIEGRGSTGAPHDEATVAHLVRSALMRMCFEATPVVPGLRRGRSQPIGDLHREAFPNWTEEAGQMVAEPPPASCP